ncbi:hypothetical protein [Nesterenkonia natronophila]|uniref:AbiEi antitoxin C-terminal domain-containing protein n=1 Tax=Nesterenkonia natronophila TaxID=2174932 RepID=A0A3A4F474_9MICC|nr:hypothetical protein [Nesterenkonia natronophila]RJN31280.1 hypothetical protein D3250_10575 [Nesterenkonia natronophila]
MTAPHSVARAGELREYLHRAGKPFTSGELQAMCQRGVMRHIIDEVYAEAVLPEGPAVRAAGALALLRPPLAEHCALCGESAAWVHLGTDPPRLVTVLVGAHADRQYSSGGVQQHRGSLGPEETQRWGPVACTTPLRTAGDLFCGTGVRHLRRALDRILDGGSRAERILRQWPAAQAPLLGRDEDLDSLGPEDERIVHQRWHTIGELLQKADADPEQLADVVMRIVSRTGWDQRRRERIRQLIAQCVSRRLPTVR